MRVGYIRWPGEQRAGIGLLIAVCPVNHAEKWVVLQSDNGYQLTAGRWGSKWVAYTTRGRVDPGY